MRMRRQREGRHQPVFHASACVFRVRAHSVIGVWYATKISAFYSDLPWSVKAFVVIFDEAG
jgi:hypothetical protein